jgi:hypothetical protein
LSATERHAGLIRIIVIDAPDLRSVLEDGGDLVADIARHTAGDHAAEVRYWTGLNLEGLAASLTARSDELAEADVVLLSAGLAIPLDGRSTDIEQWFTAPLAEAIGVLKRHNVFVLVFNGSTYDPSETSLSWTDSSRQPSLVVHRLDAAFIGLSVLDGISIVDVDRLIAEMGGIDGVKSLFHYTPAGAAAVRAEIVRILDESRFFTSGHTVSQIGLRRDASAI